MVQLIFQIQQKDGGKMEVELHQTSPKKFTNEEARVADIAYDAIIKAVEGEMNKNKNGTIHDFDFRKKVRGEH